MSIESPPVEMSFDDYTHEQIKRAVQQYNENPFTDDAGVVDTIERVLSEDIGQSDVISGCIEALQQVIQSVFDWSIATDGIGEEVELCAVFGVRLKEEYRTGSFDTVGDFIELVYDLESTTSPIESISLVSVYQETVLGQEYTVWYHEHDSMYEHYLPITISVPVGQEEEAPQMSHNTITGRLLRTSRKLVLARSEIMMGDSTDSGDGMVVEQSKNGVDEEYIEEYQLPIIVTLLIDDL